ncbi:MAG: hypothetical protein IPK08_15855 [Bacteroidetes bacterium]|nr:hypothetical protein [Bacteroidota bacterium]
MIFQIRNKIVAKGHYSVSKKLQDILGVRIVTYFYDDIGIIYDYLRASKSYVSEQVDKPELSVFKPKRTNLILKLDTYSEGIFNDTINTLEPQLKELIDSTYEVQLRTTFSEGWHEIDHSLRYKCNSNWNGLPEEERLFNGIYASLETSDHSLIKLFDDIAFVHFKSGNVENLLRTKFRLNFGENKINIEILRMVSNHLLIKKYLN